MKSSFRKIGDFIQQVKVKNTDGEYDQLLGINIDKYFMPSVANIVGTDLTKYKVVEKAQFACNRMHVGRDYRIPIALSKSVKPFIVSPAYTVFEIIDGEEVFPAYLMMWFSRPEFDRNAWFHTDADVRGGLPWDLFCNLELPIPSIEKQLEIVKEYNTVVNRIKLNEQLNKKLEETAQAIYKHWFVDFEFPTNPPPSEGCPQDGVVTNAPPNKPQKRNTKAYNALPYNPKLKDRARALRKAGNLAKVLFWQQVHKGKFKGLDFDRQKIIGNYIVDFYCANVNAIIEVDGSSHNNKQEYDAKRDEYLQSLGLTVIHITDTNVKKDLSNTMEWLRDHPAFQAPLQRRGSMGYKSSGGKMVFNAELDKEIPEGWEVKTVEEFSSDMKSGGTPNRGTNEYWDSNDYPWVKTGELKNSVVIEAEEYITEQGLRESSAKLLPINSVLVAMYGQGNTKGQVGYLKIPSATNQACCAIICENEKRSTYLYYYLRVNRDDVVSVAIGGAQPNLSKEIIENLILLEPKQSILENHSFVEIMNHRENITRENWVLNQMKNLLLSKMTKVELKKEVAV